VISIRWFRSQGQREEEHACAHDVDRRLERIGKDGSRAGHRIGGELSDEDRDADEEGEPSSAYAV
jgi:hypothetical protein